jgi:Transposase DDE domain
LPAQQVWNLYRHRADAENGIKELKYDFGFDSFNIESFYGTEAALNMVMMAYNPMSLFRQVIMGNNTNFLQ